MKYCTMTEKRFALKEGTKTVYELTEETVKELTEEQYGYTTDPKTQKFFRRLGGSETAVRSYTSRGYNVVQLTSKSPDRSVKVVRTFDFSEDTND